MMKSVLLRIALVVVAACAAPQASGQTAGAPPPPRVRRADDPPRPPKPPPGQLDAGKYEGGRYVNDFFGLTFTPPPNWVAASAAKNAELAERVKSAVTNDDRQKQTLLQESVERSRILLSMTKLPPGQPANASLMLVAERVPSPDIKTGADVFRLLEAGFRNTPFKVEFQGAARAERIGAAEFSAATIKVSSPYGVYMQKIYIAMKKGYSLQFFFTYLEDGDLPSFDAAMKSVVIK
jgi:hypothetical protein